MTHLIDKSTLVAEIERRQGVLDLDNPLGRGGMVELECLKNSLDTLEVKEVDINEEAKRKWDSFSLCYDELRGCDVVVWPYWVYKQVCKYFFELGIKAQKGE